MRDSQSVCAEDRQTTKLCRKESILKTQMMASSRFKYVILSSQTPIMMTGDNKMTPCRTIVGYQLLHSDPSDSASVRMIIIDWEDPNSLLLISVSGARITPHVAVAYINSRKSHYVGIVAATSPRMHRGGARVDSGEIGMWAISTARSPRIRQVNCQREGFWQRERRNGLSTFGPSFRVNSCHVLLAKSTLHQFSLSHARIDPRSHL